MPSAAPDFAGVYEEQVWRVYGFFAYRMGSRPDAEDLTQQTFERALRAWQRYDPSRASPATWLLTIARNLLIDHHRATGTTQFEPLETVDPESIGAVHDQYNVGIEPDLEQALAQLSPRDREIIALRFGGEMSGQEIANMTALSLANVQQILSRSLRQMRRQLDTQQPAPDARAGVP